MAKLYFYYSAMNAGKSTVLLQSSYNYNERGMKTLLFIPAIDTRYRKGKIHSRIGLVSDAVPFDSDFDLYKYVDQYLLNNEDNIKCTLVDEAQFLTKDQVYQLTDIADRLNIPVLAYGLRTDYMGEPFVGSKYLLSLAEEIVEIKTVCHCGRKAIMNMRIDEKGNKVFQGSQIHIGGNDSYTSTCRRHFKLADSGTNNDNND
jgi:thymidine kinase